MRLPFSPTQTAVGVGLLVVLVLLVLTVILIRRARAKATRRARTEAALGAPNPSSTLPAPEPPTIKASPPRYPPGAPGAPGLASQPPVQVERDPTEPIPTAQLAPAGLVDRPPGDAEQNGAGTYPPGHRPSGGSSVPGAAEGPETASEDEPPAEADTAEEAAEPSEPAAEPEPTAERPAERKPFVAPLMASAEVVRRADASPAVRAAGAPVTDAKDRLLRVLLTDPERALHAVGDLETCRQRLDELHQSMHQQQRQLADAARRLRGAGLTPAQVARLAGFGEGELVSLLAEHAPSPVPRPPRPTPRARSTPSEGRQRGTK
jgi:hypothetical protein